MALKCPRCGQGNLFHVNQWIEHHDVVIDPDGHWVEDLGAYESKLDVDGAMCSCPDCGYDGEYREFEGA